MRFRQAIVYVCAEHAVSLEQSGAKTLWSSLSTDEKMTTLCCELDCKQTAHIKLITALETQGHHQRAIASITSEKKAAAVRENGKLGGRPKGRKNNPKPGA